MNTRTEELNTDTRELTTEELDHVVGGSKTMEIVGGIVGGF